MKIIRKPRPIGNELKTVIDANTHIVLHMELHESKEEMANKDHVKELGATAACCLRLTDYWKGIYMILKFLYFYSHWSFNIFLIANIQRGVDSSLCKFIY